MVGHCLERQLAVNRDCVFVATCDRESDYVADRGDNAVMTSDMHRRTTRTAEALETIEGTGHGVRHRGHGTGR